MKPNFRPELCPKSLELSKDIAQGGFLDRVERDVLNRKEQQYKKEQGK